MKILNKIIEENEIKEDAYFETLALINDISNILDITVDKAKGIFNQLKFSKDTHVVDNILSRYNVNTLENADEKLEQIYKLIKRL